MVMNKLVMATGILATAGATGLGVDPALFAEWGRWPATATLGAVAMVSVYWLYKQGLKFAEAQKEMANAIRDLAKELAERPCIRKPSND